MGILSTKHGYQVKVHGNARQLEHRLRRWTVGSNLAGNPDESDRRKVRPRVRQDAVRAEAGFGYLTGVEQRILAQEGVAERGQQAGRLVPQAQVAVDDGADLIDQLLAVH